LDDISILGSIISIDAVGAYSLLGTFGGGFGWGKIITRVYCNNKNLSRPFHHRWGAAWDGLQQTPLDGMFYL
jgi:hypothetical protein